MHSVLSHGETPAESCPSSFSAPRMRVAFISRSVDSKVVQLLAVSKERDPRSAAPSQTLGHCFPIGTHNIQNSYILHDKNNSQNMRERSVLASWKQRTLTKFDVDRRSQRQMLYPPYQACTVTRRHHLAAYPCGTSANAARPVYLGCLGQLTRSPHEGHKVKFTRTIHIGQILTSHPITIRHE